MEKSGMVWLKTEKAYDKIINITRMKTGGSGEL